jgi:hypothetical protein
VRYSLVLYLASFLAYTLEIKLEYDLTPVFLGCNLGTYGRHSCNF